MQNKIRKLVGIVHQSRPEQLAELYPASEIRGIVVLRSRWGNRAAEDDGVTSRGPQHTENL